jgi:hypothetical protein
MKKVLILTVIAMIMLGCKPDADFTTDSTVYGPGEVIQLKNTSKKGKKYKWTFPDGTTSPLESPVYFVPSNQAIGSILNIKLEVFSTGSIRKDEVSRTLSVGGSGNVTFYGASNWSFYVTVDNNQTQYASSLSSQPTCGENWSANFTLPVGNHTYIAKKGTSTLGSGTITVKRNSCTLIGI